jgi:hypothetical protein
MHPRTAATVGLLLAALTLSACVAAPQPTEAEARPTQAESVLNPSDEWQGHFDDRAATFGGAGVAWGGFGGSGRVAAVGLTAASLATGDHVVAIECAGPDAVSVELTPGADAGLPTNATVRAAVPCPGGASIPIATDIVGLTVGVDSHGEQGAYLIAIDAATASG